MIAATLQNHETELIYLFVEGYTTPQIRRRMHLTIGEFQVRRKQLFQKLGARTRAHAVAIAIVRYGLPPPGDLEPLIKQLDPDTFEYANGRDEAILRLLAEGHRAAMVAAIFAGLDDDGPDEVAALAAQFGITMHQFARLVGAAVWAGLLVDLDLDRRKPLRPDDYALMQEVALGWTDEAIALKWNVPRSTAKGRIVKVMFRLDAKSRAAAVSRLIKAGSLPVPDDPKTQARIWKLRDRGLSPLELDVLHYRMEARSYEWIARRMRFKTVHQPSHVLVRLYRCLDIGGSHALDVLSAVVLWAGEPMMAAKPLFSDYEQTLLVLVIWGLTGQAIADQVGKPKPTVDEHIHQIYLKLGAHNAEQAVALAAFNRVIELATDQEIAPLVRAPLSEEECRVAELVAGGLNYTAVAAAIGRSTQTVSRRVEKARKVVRAAITTPGYEPIAVSVTTAIALLARAGRIAVPKRDYSVAPPDEASTRLAPIADEDLWIIDWLKGGITISPSGVFVFDEDTEEIIAHNARGIVALTRAGLVDPPVGLEAFLANLQRGGLSRSSTSILQARADGMSERAAGREFDRPFETAVARIRDLGPRFKVRTRGTKHREAAIWVLALWAEMID